MGKTAIIIPARYGSSRLEGKPLIKVLDKPIIQWVWEKAKKCTNADRRSAGSLPEYPWWRGSRSWRRCGPEYA